jgi:hypothetical protein
MFLNFSKTRGVTFVLVVFVFLNACSGNDEPSGFDCSTSDLSIISEGLIHPVNCAGGGSITVAGTGGKAPYTYALNAGAFANAGDFTNLAAGDYTIRVKDKNGCQALIELSLQLPGADPLTAEASLTADTECFSNNGIIEIVATGGQEPYQYKFGNGVFGSDFSFEGLAPGNYSVSVKDALDCIFVKSISVVKGNSQTSLRNDIEPIIEENCALSDCHGGSESPSLTSLSAIRNNATAIKRETQNGNMPEEGSLTEEQKALIACWVDEGAHDN